MTRPNLFMIVTDDMGFSDLGCYGSEIKTPNIDRLAEEGIRFSDYHTSVMCSVARAMFLSGTDSHIAMEAVAKSRADAGSDNEMMNGKEMFLSRSIAGMPEILQDAGYNTYMSGKWHLGLRPGYLPSDRGFDKVLSMLPACGNHFGWDPQWPRGEESRPGIHGHQPPLYVEQDKRYVPEPNMASSSDGFNTTKTFADTMLANLKDRSADELERPFFAYLPFVAPHYPLQCLKSDRDDYKGVYDEGPDVLRRKRLAGLRNLGVIPEDVRPHHVVAPDTAQWDEMSDKEKKFSSRSMEVYAGMIQAVDRETGKILDYLRETGELDNTMVLFFSDNGAEGSALEAEEVTGPKLIEVINTYYNNEYDNIGNVDSFAWLGPRWCQAATAPHRLYKHYTTEGGIRVPLVVRYPGFDHIPPGNISHAFTTAMDILPTFLELAGISHPNPNPAHPRELAKFRGREVFPMRGRSWVPYLRDGRTTAKDPTEAVWDGSTHVAWEHSGKMALRSGRWKMVNMPKHHPTGLGQWQLYDLASDQGETDDVSTRHPEVLARLKQDWKQWLEETQAPFFTAAETEDGLLEDDIIHDHLIWMRLGHGQSFDAQPM